MKTIQDDFPILAVPENGKRLIYLDNAATTPKPLPVLRAVEEYYSHDNANPHRGVYELSVRATDAHEGARKTVAEFLNADPDEIIFTQNTTESLNLTAYSYGLEFLTKGDEIALSVAEHHSNLVPWQRVARATGAKLVYIYPGPDGRLTEEELDKKITSRTRLVAIAQVSNVLGIKVPVESIVRRAHGQGAVVVLDCAQSAPHLPVDVKALDVDFAAFSGHKLYAPMGIGVLYGKKELLEKMPPFLSGGDMISSVHEQSVTYAEVPRCFEAGTRNVGGEVGLAAAIRYIQSLGWEKIQSHEQSLMARALEGLSKLSHVTVYGDPRPQGRYGVISFNVEGVHPHDTATVLDADGITVRAGHHCAQPLMDFLGINACVRASFAVCNTAEDVDAFLNSVENVRRWMGLGA
ncbi:aminotransferase class V-fold PLP-dependent enzyme [Clostridium sp. Marseille-P2415]|uniref:aminotransferase class V-fold PLP-dependent enzyme n=1 Tax=Clostridium sp. Marseille-P2415 TaxID=1805471 RepID=UPI0009888340|nr:cysteine desulfurase [Clostridium sp. Marseille-P2415]